MRAARCRCVAGLSRRAVLNRFGMGLGGIALANLVNPQSQIAGGAGRPGPRRARRAVPRSAEGQARHLSVHGRRAVADGDVRLQAGAEPAQRRAAARFGPPGAAAHRHVGQPVVAAARRVAVRVQPARRQRHLGQRSAAAHRARSSTTSASSARCTPRPSTTIRRSRSSRADRRSPAARAWARGCTTGSAATTRTCRRSSC